VGARNEYVVVVREYKNLNPVVKGVVSAISGNPTHANHDVFPRLIKKSSKKQRHIKRRELLHEASGANSTFNSSVDNDRIIT